MGVGVGMGLVEVGAKWSGVRLVYKKAGKARGWVGGGIGWDRGGVELG